MKKGPRRKSTQIAKTTQSCAGPGFMGHSPPCRRDHLRPCRPLQRDRMPGDLPDVVHNGQRKRGSVTGRNRRKIDLMG